jgi:predicted Zn-dependent protease
MVQAMQLSGLPLPAAEPPRPAVDPFFVDPNVILDRLFGEETEQDEEALAEIEVSARQERQMGEKAVEAYLGMLKNQRIRVASRGKDVQYLQDLVDSLHPLMSQRRRYPFIKIYVAESSRCDARSFPGGTLVFFRGLLELADSEAAVVGIVGHELSHLDRGHHLLRARRMKLAQQTLSDSAGQFSPERFFAAGTAMARIWTRPFQPEDEAEADRDGARWAYLAGYDARKMAELFMKLRDRHRLQELPIPSFMRSHPAAGDRHADIIDLYQQLQEEKPNDKPYIGKENLRRRVARTRREFAE